MSMNHTGPDELHLVHTHCRLEVVNIYDEYYYILTINEQTPSYIRKY